MNDSCVEIKLLLQRLKRFCDGEDSFFVTKQQVLGALKHLLSFTDYSNHLPTRLNDIYLMFSKETCIVEEDQQCGIEVLCELVSRSYIDSDIRCLCLSVLTQLASISFFKSIICELEDFFHPVVVSILHRQHDDDDLRNKCLEFLYELSYAKQDDMASKMAQAVVFSTPTLVESILQLLKTQSNTEDVAVKIKALKILNSLSFLDCNVFPLYKMVNPYKPFVLDSISQTNVELKECALEFISNLDVGGEQEDPASASSSDGYGMSPMEQVVFVKNTLIEVIEQERNGSRILYMALNLLTLLDDDTLLELVKEEVFSMPVSRTRLVRSLVQVAVREKNDSTSSLLAIQLISRLGELGVLNIDVVFGKILAVKQCNLTSLNLSHLCSINNTFAGGGQLVEFLSDIRCISNSLNFNRQLITLNLSKNQISDISVLASALAKNKSLRYLDLSYNRIRNLDLLKDTLLTMNESLISLDLSNNLIHDCAEFYLRLKRGNLCLEQVQLDNNPGFAPFHFQQAMLARRRYLARYFSLLVLTKAKHSPEELVNLCFDRTSFQNGIFMHFSLNRCVFLPTSVLGRVCLFLGG